ncbi:hypothetical protein [Mesorhizobium sanjuanii]|nr:hypothetical protein [Mesorhizobium sanjuanii]
MQSFAARLRKGQGKAGEDAAQRAGERDADVSGSRIGFNLLKFIRQS